MAEPVNTVAPSISGVASVGSTLTCGPGSWDQAVTLAYQWLRETGAGTGVYAAIGGSTTTTYVCVAGDVGRRVDCDVTATSSGVLLTWAPPTLTSPTNATVTNTNYNFIAPSLGLDLHLTFGEILTEKRLLIQGWRNVVLVGGEMVNNNAISAQIAIFHCTGRVHIEGVLLRGTGVIDAGFGLSTGGLPGQGADVVLQNIRSTTAYSGGTHADNIQLWGPGSGWLYGGVKNLLIDRFTGLTEYQGIFLGNHDGPLAGGDLRNVEVVGSNDSAEHLIWKTYRTDAWGNTSTVTLTNCWMRQVGTYGGRPSDWLMPNSTGYYTSPADPSRAAVDGTDGLGQYVEWVSGSDMVGRVHVGDGSVHGAGCAIAGLGYVTPGYAP